MGSRVDEIIEATMQNRNLGEELMRAVREASDAEGQRKLDQVKQAENVEALDGGMTALHEKFDRFDVAKKDAERWQAEAESSQKEIGRTRKELEKWRVDAQASQELSTRLNAETQDLKSQVKKLTVELANQPLPTPTIMQKIKTLES